MTKIQEIINEYKSKIDYLDLEILIAYSLGKTREFVLIHPEQPITKKQETIIKKNIGKRIEKEPTAYIIGHKEFYGLDFIVNKHTLVPRPETEMIVEQILSSASSNQPACRTGRSSEKITVIDIGTGSGCIAISIAKKMTDNGLPMTNYTFFASDISEGALKIAKKNAELHSVDKKIKFLQGSLLSPFSKANKLMPEKLLITANLPYLSKDVYDSAPVDVKKFEPKSALYSAEAGLAHYRKLLLQIKKLHVPRSTFHVTCFFEISPEQKTLLAKLIQSIFPSAKIEFQKDLAKKWRLCKITL